MSSQSELLEEDINFELTDLGNNIYKVKILINWIKDEMDFYLM